MIEEQLAMSIYLFINGRIEDKFFDAEIIDGFVCDFELTVKKVLRYVNDFEPEETTYLYTVWIQKIKVWDEDGSESFEMDHTLVQETLNKILFDHNQN